MDTVHDVYSSVHGAYVQCRLKLLRRTAIVDGASNRPSICNSNQASVTPVTGAKAKRRPTLCNP